MLQNASVLTQGINRQLEPSTKFQYPGGGYEQAILAGMRVLDNEYKLRQNIKIAMLYLEDDDAVNAEAFIKKAASLITSSKVGRQPDHTMLQCNLRQDPCLCLSLTLWESRNTCVKLLLACWASLIQARWSIQMPSTSLNNFSCTARSFFRSTASA